MATEAQRRANQQQDATRQRVAIWLEPKTTKKLDRLRGNTPRAEFVRALIEAHAQS